MRIQILNPLPGGSKHTTIRRAWRFVLNHRAVFEGDSIRFCAPTEPDMLAAIDPRKLTGMHYDRIDRIMSRRERRAIPVISLLRLR